MVIFHQDAGLPGDPQSSPWWLKNPAKNGPRTWMIWGAPDWKPPKSHISCHHVIIFPIHIAIFLGPYPIFKPRPYGSKLYPPLKSMV